MNSLAWKYLDRGLMVRLLVLIVLQQLVTVSGTYALAQAGFNIESMTSFFNWICVALASHLISPFFGLWIRPLEVRLSYRAYRKFLQEKLFSQAGNPSLWTLKSQRETYLASLGVETDSYLGAIIFVGLDVFSYLLSLLFGVAVLGLVLDSSFFGAFLVSGVLSGFCFFLLQKQVTYANESEQDGRLAVSSVLLLAWDNIFFKNKMVIKRFGENFESVFAKSQELSRSATRWSESLVVILSTVSALPIVATILWMASRETLATSVLVGLLATVPRQLNLLSTFRSVFQSVTSFISFEAKLKSLSQNADLSSVPLLERIQTSDIVMNCGENDRKEIAASAEAMAEFIQNSSPQRITLRGRNGAGKSTLLLHLNEVLAESFYMPSHPQFVLGGISKGASTGQNIQAHLNYVKELDCKYLLLDEWDANLDAENIRKIHQILEELSQTKVIVEVRHRT